jgi:DNA-binding MarR family transcriptional regulator
VNSCRYNSNSSTEELKRQPFVCDNETVSTHWLDEDESAAWVRLAALVELLPGVLDSQLRRDAELMHFEYFVLAMLSEAPRRTLRMTYLAAQTNATLPRLSHVVRRLEDRGLVERFPCPTDARATNARLTAAGWRKVREAAPGHVATVRHHVIDALTTDEVIQLRTIADAILARLDPNGAMTDMYRRHDRPKNTDSSTSVSADTARAHLTDRLS